METTQSPRGGLIKSHIFIQQNSTYTQKLKKKNPADSLNMSESQKCYADWKKPYMEHILWFYLSEILE